ncbi:hypothetical protein VNI00_008496, partial [Paramarasmius palmivorus]
LQQQGLSFFRALIKGKSLEAYKALHLDKNTVNLNYWMISPREDMRATFQLQFKAIHEIL